MRLDHLTFTRFLAALTVVIFHYGGHLAPFNLQPFDQLFQAGPIAVSYFYALSGFIMAIAYYRPNSPENFNRWKYWLARFARIYPVYLVALLLVFFANYRQTGNATENATENAVTQLLLNLSMLQAWVPTYPLSLNSPGWSLSVEAFFYLCLPLLLWIIYRGGLKILMGFSVVLWFATQLLHIYYLNSADYRPLNALHDFIYYNPLMHLNTFLAGLMVGIVFYTKLMHKPPHRYNTVLLLSTMAVIVLLLILRPRFDLWFSLQIDYTNGLIAPLFLLFIVLLARSQGLISTLLAAPSLVLLGEASYSLYILQRPVYGLYHNYFAKHLAVSELWHFYFYLLLLIALSIASYKLFETPLRQWINTRVSWQKNGVKSV